MFCCPSQMPPSALNKVGYGVTFGFVFGRVNKTETKSQLLKTYSSAVTGENLSFRYRHPLFGLLILLAGVTALSASLGSSLTLLIFLFLKCLKFNCFLSRILAPAVSHISRK